MLGLVPSALVLAFGVVFTRVVETLVGRDVTWKVAAYTWPALVILVAALLGAAASTLLARSWQWHRAHRDARVGDVRSVRDAVGVDGADGAGNAPSLVL